MLTETDPSCVLYFLVFLITALGLISSSSSWSSTKGLPIFWAWTEFRMPIFFFLLGGK